MARELKTKYLMLETTKLWPSAKSRKKWRIDPTGAPFYSGYKYFLPKYLGEELIRKGLAVEKRRR